MRLRAAVVAMAAVLLPVLLAPGVSAAPAYGHAGRWITDTQGRVVIPHGVNMVNKHAPYAPEAVGFGADDAEFLAANGFDTVRVGLIWKAVEPEPGRYDDDYLASIRRTVEVLAAHGITSLLDMHQDQYNERFQGEFAPDWAVLDDGLPAQPRLGFPLNLFVQPSLWRAYEHFLANTPGPGGIGIQDRFAAAWAHTAAYFRDADGVLGYDLLNEPWPGASYPTCLLPGGCVADEQLTTLFRNLTRAVRSTDPTTLVFAEPVPTSVAPTNLGSLNDPNTGWSFHYYCIWASVTDAGCDTLSEQVFASAEAYSARTGAALLLTEFGATDDTDQIEAVIARAAATGIGWQYWAYCGCADPTTTDQAGQGLVGDPIAAPTGANVDATKLFALATPHPKAVAGIPVSSHLDRATGSWELAYRTTRADGSGNFAPGATTTLSIPRTRYQGYVAEVRGARVVSAPDAPVLELQSLPGATEVTVHVTPR
jgi:endoglycosylceramidase